MKAKDLIPPYVKGHPVPYLYEDVYFFPQWKPQLDGFQSPSWEDIFKRKAPLSIEFCSGNGDWILEKALQNPQENWIAVEKRFDRVRKLWAKMRNQNVQNIRIFCGMGEDLLSHCIKQEEADACYVNFPDPWPKKRHHKNRLFSSDFVEALSKILAPRSVLQLVSDDFPYVNWALKNLLENPKFSSLVPAPFYKKQEESHGFSYFDSLWREKGREIYTLKFKKGTKKDAQASSCNSKTPAMASTI